MSTATDGFGRFLLDRFPSRPPIRVTRIAVLAVVGFVVLSPLAGSLRHTPRDKIGISYGGGRFEGAHFQRVVAPGSDLFVNGISDRLYL